MTREEWEARVEQGGRRGWSRKGGEGGAGW